MAYYNEAHRTSLKVKMNATDAPLKVEMNTKY